MEVINGLAKRYQLRIQYTEKHGRKSDVLTEAEQEWIVNVDRPDIAYINPGREDNVYIGKKRREKRRCSKVLSFVGIAEFAKHYKWC